MNCKKIFFKNYLILLLNLNLFSKCCYKNNELKNDKKNNKKNEDIFKKNKNNIEVKDIYIKIFKNKIDDDFIDEYNYFKNTWNSNEEIKPENFKKFEFKGNNRYLFCLINFNKEIIAFIDCFLKKQDYLNIKIKKNEVDKNCKKYISINYFYCHKKYRYKGLGTKLFLYFLLKQPKNTYFELVADSEDKNNLNNNKLIEYYKNFGFISSNINITCMNFYKKDDFIIYKNKKITNSELIEK